MSAGCTLLRSIANWLACAWKYLETIFQPERILAGGEGELIAVRELEQGKFLAVFIGN